MAFLTCLLIFGTFEYIDSLNPRSVNVALETVLEFDGKHSYRDVKAIDKLQSYLTRIKSILGDNDDRRRHLKEGFKFRDFLKIWLQTLSTYDDNDLLDVVAIVNSEIRKYHYKGCKFYELVENQVLRRDMADKLINLNELTARELRTEIKKAISAIDNDFMNDRKKKMLDYLDSVYVGDEVKAKMQQFLSALNQFKQRSKRASLSLVKVIKEGLRSVIFDHYSNLNANARKELKNRLEDVWLELKKIKEDVWNISHSTDPVVVQNTVNQGKWKTITTKLPTSTFYNDVKIVYPERFMVKKKSIGRKRKHKKAKRVRHLPSPEKTETKKRKKTKKTTMTATKTEKDSSLSDFTGSLEVTPSAEVVPSAEVAHSAEVIQSVENTRSVEVPRSTEVIASAEVTSSVEATASTEGTTSPEVTKATTRRKRKRTHHTENPKKQALRIGFKTRTTPMKKSTEEVKSNKLSKSINSLEVHKKSSLKKSSPWTKNIFIEIKDLIEIDSSNDLQQLLKEVPEASLDTDTSKVVTARSHKKHKLKQRGRIEKKKRHSQRKRKETDATIKVIFKKQKSTPVSASLESDDYDTAGKITTTPDMRKSNLVDKFKSVTENNTEINSNTDVNSVTAPNVIYRMNRIEKVLDEIKDIVKNVSKVNNKTEVLTTEKSITVEVSTKKIRPADKENKTITSPVRKSLVEDREHDLEEIDNFNLITKKIKQKPEEQKTSTTQVSSDATAITVPKIVKNLGTQSINDDDSIIITRRNTVEFLLSKKTAEDTTVRTSIKNDLVTTTKKTTDLTLNDTNTLDKMMQTNREKIEKIINETRRSGVDNVIGRHDEENKEMNKEIDKKIEADINTLFSVSGKVNTSKTFDFNIEDPFDMDTQEDHHGGADDVF